MSDILTPFLLNEAPVRGRIVRLSESVNKILTQHQYPQRISELLAETLTMAAILSSNLKQDGIFTIQIQSKGALSLLVVDATAEGHLRGYAQFDEDGINETPKLNTLCSEGYLAITLDPGAGGQRYQGVVPLEGESIAETMQHYFTQSQQLMVSCKLTVSKGDEGWQAAGIYVENVPENAQASEESEAWREAQILLHTVKEEELLDQKLAPADLLYRLFHESGVWVYEAQPIKAECRCNREKIEQALKTIDASELAEMAINQSIVVDCQFCGSKEIFALDELSVAQG